MKQLQYLLALTVGLMVMNAPSRAQDKPLPTLFIIGDSTVRNSATGLQGWGDVIGESFDQTKIKIENRARGGRSSRTFFTEGLWDQVVAQLRPGDFVLMQFGHNDGGAVNDDSRARGSLRGTGDETEEIDNLLTKKHEVVHTYGWYLRKFVTDTKAKGATAIVLSQVPRNIWKDGKVERVASTYGGWAAEVGKSAGGFFIDLNEFVARQYETIGPEKVGKDYFLTDHTHTTPLGAQLNAQAVVFGITRLKNCSLATFLLNKKTSSSPPRGFADPKGPFAPTWDSLKQNYKPPQWFQDGKFGIFIHWGLYSIPAHRSEWYAKHMYNDREISRWHTEHYGPPDKFGYKDFIPLFKAEKYDAAAWAVLFRKSGARYVVPVAEHHDGFAMYDSSLTRWNAKNMGPKRDLIGDLANAVRKQGLVFGLSYHRMEHHTFMYPATGIKTDQFDPAYADFYGPPIPGDMDDANAPPAFQEDWLTRCKELVDRYHPQLVYFDNGVNQRAYDPVKLRFAAYFYNRALEWKREVTINTKDAAYLAGSIVDFEKDLRGPGNFLPARSPYQIDDVISDRSWGYVSDMKYRSVGSILNELIDTVSKNGNLMLNISPMGDGSIPEPQQKILLEIGRWLETNGEAIYSTRPWTTFGEGPIYEAQVAGANPHEAGRKAPTGADFRFTTKGHTLYAIALAWPGEQAIITSLATGKASVNKIKSVRLLGRKEKLGFSKDQAGLKITLPAEKPGDYAFVFRIELAAH